MKKQILFIFLLLLNACGGNSTTPNLLLLPQELALDTANSRLFVVDASNNNFSLINTTDNSVVTSAPLLNNDSALRFAQSPQDIAVQDMGSGLSRIFILGNGTTNSNQITVLDYDTSTGLRAASFNPISVGNTSGDLLGGLALDSTNNRLFVSNSSQDLLHAFNTEDGTVILETPLSISDAPARMSFNESISRLFISSSASNNISVVNTDDLSAPVESLDVEGESTSVTSSSNTTGSVLAVLYPSTNEIRIFNLDLTTLASSTLIGDPLLPLSAGTAISATTPLSGAASRLKSAQTADGKIAIFITQSTGDLGTIDVSSDLTSYSTGRISVGSATSASGIDISLDSSNFGTRVYFAAPNGSSVSVVDIVSRALSTQLF